MFLTPHLTHVAQQFCFKTVLAYIQLALCSISLVMYFLFVSRWWLKCVGPCQPCRRTSFWLLDLAWSNPGCCGHLWSEIVYRILIFLSVNLFFKFKKKQKVGLTLEHATQALYTGAGSFPILAAFATQLSADDNASVWAQVLTWATWIMCLAPGFSMTQTHPRGEWTNWKNFLCSSFSVFNYAFQK